MKQILETIIKNIVENQEAVSIVEKEETEKIIYEVKVDNKDMGRIIGKQGKVANSIRTLMKSLAKDKRKVIVEFLETLLEIPPVVYPIPEERVQSPPK